MASLRRPKPFRTIATKGLMIDQFSSGAIRLRSPNGAESAMDGSPIAAVLFEILWLLRRKAGVPKKRVL